MPTYNVNTLIGKPFDGYTNRDGTEGILPNAKLLTVKSLNDILNGDILTQEKLAELEEKIKKAVEISESNLNNALGYLRHGKVCGCTCPEALENIATVKSQLDKYLKLMPILDSDVSAEDYSGIFNQLVKGK